VAVGGEPDTETIMPSLFFFLFFFFFFFFLFGSEAYIAKIHNIASSSYFLQI
jgi:hypothetical protein